MICRIYYASYENMYVLSMKFLYFLPPEINIVLWGRCNIKFHGSSINICKRRAKLNIGNFG